MTVPRSLGPFPYLLSTVYESGMVLGNPRGKRARKPGPVEATGCSDWGGSLQRRPAPCSVTPYTAVISVLASGKPLTSSGPGCLPFTRGLRR